MFHRISTGSIYRFVFVSILPVLLAVMMVFGYPGSTPVIQAAGTPGALVPMGDALGDVGQYYSQVDPSQLSRLGIYNPNGSSVSVSVSLYPDDGMSTVITTTCTIAANTGVEVKTDTITQTGCSNLSAQPRGVYHGVITSSGGNVAVANWINQDTTTGNPLITGAYEAVQAGITSTTHYLYGVLVRGTSGNDWTDTEFVVQNPSTTTDAYVQFTLCESNGTTCWDNNSAVVRKTGHRVFLLSQLAYQDNGGSLTEKSGGLSVKLTVTNSVPVATMANLFRQSVPTTKTLPMAETGSQWMVSFGQQRAASSGVIPRFYRGSSDSSSGYSHAVKVQNLGTSSTTVTVELRDANGNVPTNGTVSKSVGANATVGFNSYEFNVGAGTYAARIYSSGSNNLAAWHWSSSADGYYGDVWQPYSTVLTGTYLPVVRAGFWSWSTDVGSYASNVSTWGYIPGNLELTVGGSYNTSVVLGNAKHANQSAGSSFTGAPTYGNVHTTSGPYSGSSANVNSLPVIYKSGSGDTRVAYNATWQAASTWYVPFAPSPVVAFAWDTEDNVDYPDGKYGVAPAGGNAGRSRAAWLKEQNWIGWTGSSGFQNAVSNCNGAEADGKSRYIPDWWGLGATGLYTDTNGIYPFVDTADRDDGWVKSGYNSNVRLGKIRNVIPSACAGRPAQVVNEPLNTGEGTWGPSQANMTYSELGRAAFLYRTWPGDLYGPSFYHVPYWSHGPMGNDCGNPSGTFTGSDPSGNPTNLVAGKLRARYTCYDGFLAYLSTTSEIVSGKTFTYTDFFDGTDIHFYPIWSDVSADNGNNPASDYTGDATYYIANILKSRSDAIGTKLIITEYGLLSGTASQVADRIATYNAIIDDRLGNISRLWYTDKHYLSDGYEINDIFTATTGTTTTVVGSAWINKLK